MTFGVHETMVTQPSEKIPQLGIPESDAFDQEIPWRGTLSDHP